MISVVIPSCRDEAGLYFTYAAASEDLRHFLNETGEESEIIVVADGETNPTVHALSIRHNLCRVIPGWFGSPQAARHAGISIAQGEYVFCLDSHVVPCRDFFARIVATARATRAAIVHSPHWTWGPRETGYGFGVNWCGNLWSKDHEPRPQSANPYRVAMMGHGGICIERQAYFDAGGYWLEQRGWGGEESHLALKFWMLGRACWVEPRAHHWHWMAKRRGASVFRSRDHVRNFLLSAYALGGQKYLDSCFLFYEMNAGARGESYRDLYEAAPAEAAAERTRICAGPFEGNLDRLREWFRIEGIPN